MFYESETLSSFARRLWELILYNLKKVHSFSVFKEKNENMENKSMSLPTL